MLPELFNLFIRGCIKISLSEGIQVKVTTMDGIQDRINRMNAWKDQQRRKDEEYLRKQQIRLFM